MARSATPQTLILVLPALLFVVTLILILWIKTRKGRHDKRVFAPGGRRRTQLLLLPLWLILATAFGLDWLKHRDKSPLPPLAIGLAALISGYEVFFRRSTPVEDQQNWVCDTTRCGRCEYDLTGNVSGICPECGAPIPRSADNIQKPWWGAWWMQWQIDHLIDWRKTLAVMVFNAMLFAALAAWFAFGRSGQKAFVAVPALICINMVINCVRVLQYRRRIGNE